MIYSAPTTVSRLISVGLTHNSTQDIHNNINRTYRVLFQSAMWQYGYSMAVVDEKQRKIESCVVARVIIGCARLALNRDHNNLKNIFPLAQAMCMNPSVSCRYMLKDDFCISNTVFIDIFTLLMHI